MLECEMLYKIIGYCYEPPMKIASDASKMLNFRRTSPISIVLLGILSFFRMHPLHLKLQFLKNMHTDFNSGLNVMRYTPVLPFSPFILLFFFIFCLSPSSQHGSKGYN